MSQSTSIDQAFAFQAQLTILSPQLIKQLSLLFRQDTALRTQEEWLKSPLYIKIFSLIAEQLEDISQLVIPFPDGVRM
jgi:hypothetical protein